MMMNTPAAIIALLSGLAVATHAQAGAQLTLGNSTAGTFDFTGAPPASLTVASPGIAGAGTAFFPSDSGDYVFGAVTPFAAGPLVGGNFPTGGTQSFSVAMNDGDGFVADIAWSLVKDSSRHPDLDGVLTITSSHGDAAWLTSFPAGGSADIDLALTLYPGPLLDQIATTGQQQWATISSGEIVPIMRAVPEPNMMLVFGAAILGTFLWLRRKLV